MRRSKPQRLVPSFSRRAPTVPGEDPNGGSHGGCLVAGEWAWLAAGEWLVAG